ncbi:MAG TPA: hypothetical protein VKU82_07785 [Planctomycetaceae bacterium]|nr:hypothetical protein [Planctomycetaceae bacterium]
MTSALAAFVASIATELLGEGVAFKGVVWFEGGAVSGGGVSTTLAEVVAAIAVATAVGVIVGSTFTGVAPASTDEPAF